MASINLLMFYHSGKSIDNVLIIAQFYIHMFNLAKLSTAYR